LEQVRLLGFGVSAVKSVLFTRSLEGKETWKRRGESDVVMGRNVHDTLPAGTKGEPREKRQTLRTT